MIGPIKTVGIYVEDQQRALHAADSTLSAAARQGGKCESLSPRGTRREIACARGRALP